MLNNKHFFPFSFQVGLKYDESIVIRVTGCPNGCARPYMAELGLVGDGPNSYQVSKDVESSSIRAEIGSLLLVLDFAIDIV